MTDQTPTNTLTDTDALAEVIASRSATPREPFPHERDLARRILDAGYVLVARGGNTDNTHRAAVEAVTVCPHGDRHYFAIDGTCQRCEMPSWVVSLVTTALDAAPAPTDNQHNNDLADRVKALADMWDARAEKCRSAAHRPTVTLGEQHAYLQDAGTYTDAARALRAVVDGPTSEEKP